MNTSAALASTLSQSAVHPCAPARPGRLEPPRVVRIEGNSFAKFPVLRYATTSRRSGSYRTYSQAESSVGEPEDITEGVAEDEIINVGVSDVEEPVEIPNPVSDFPTTPPPSETPVDGQASDIEELKQALFDSFYGTDRGFRASSETRGEIAEIVTQLEALNPNPGTTEALPLLEGKWVLAYTSFSELFPLLAAGSLPLVSVSEISQSIDTLSSSVKNAVTFSGPLGSSTFTTKASYEVRSSKRLQVKFEEGILEPPNITSSIQLPDSLEVAGQTVQLSSFQGVIRPLEEAASAIARLISGQPPVKFPFPSPQAQSWLLTTFLDQDVRISRGDGGSLFILVKEGSSFKP